MFILPAKLQKKARAMMIKAITMNFEEENILGYL